MAYIYNYTREFVESYNAWDINNPERKDEFGNQIPLATEVEEALPGKHFLFFGGYGGDPTVARFEFDEELTPLEVEILNLKVFEHKHNIL